MASNNGLVIGSRGSLLAMWQARWVQGRLETLGIQSRIEVIRTTGDKITDVALSKVGGKGLFTKEIEEALLDRRIDLAVHSLKDLPTENTSGLTVAAVPEREDPRDALIGSRLVELPPQARLGTSSLRRAAQLLAVRPDLRILDLRGNVDTRLRKLDAGEYDAVVLASAGLNRLGWSSRIAELQPVTVLCPAAGQGALAIQTRDDQGPAFRHCSTLDDAPSRAAVIAERAMLGALGGGCQVPIGAHAVLDSGHLRLLGVVVSPDGRKLVRGDTSGPAGSAANLGAALGRQLLATGGSEILDQVYGTQSP